MITNILAFLLGVCLGFIGGLFYYAKKIHKKMTDSEVINKVIESATQEEKKQGDFIKVNKVEEYIKTHEGEIALGDVLEDE